VSDDPKRTFLAVPFAYNASVRKLGAKFDKAARLWYVPEGVSLDDFREWLPRPVEIFDPVAQLRDALTAAGMIVKGDPIFDDKVHRLHLDARHGEHDGAYRVKMDGDRAFGWFRNYHIHDRIQPWHANGSERLTTAQRKHLAEVRAAEYAERDRKLLQQQELVAIECGSLWDNALPITTHPYLAAKGVSVPGLRQGVAGQAVTTFRDDGTPHIISLEGKLFVPMRDISGKLWSLQYISEDGRKRYHSGGKKDGCFFIIPGANFADEPAYVVEGCATGASVHHMTDQTVFVAFDSSNLSSVARAVRDNWPDCPGIAIAGDNDHTREAEGKPNAGKLAAIAGAGASGGIAVLPEFSPGDPGTDWNDVHQAKGLDEARIQFRRAVQMAERGRAQPER
jgi:putative DNA primase/helicase